MYYLKELETKWFAASITGQKLPQACFARCIASERASLLAFIGFGDIDLIGYSTLRKRFAEPSENVWQTNGFDGTLTASV